MKSVEEKIEGSKKQISDGLDNLMSRISSIFTNSSGRKTAESYLRGLLSPAERKNGWQLAESIGAETPYALQQFLFRGRFSADSLRDKLRSYVSENLGEEDGVLTVDETGFLKQGKKSCGVKRQYSGTAGRIENCQIGVFLTYTSSIGHAAIDRKLYMPEEWCEDEKRRNAAGVPKELTFQTKPEMALQMIKSAHEANVPYKWVTGDCVYGQSHEIRQWLEKNKKSFVLGLSGKDYVWQSFKQVRVSTVFNSLSEAIWQEVSCGDGSKGERIYDWLRIDLNSPSNEEKRWLLVRRSKTDKDDLRAYVCYAPRETTLEKLVQIAGLRWTIECCFAESKSEVGLDQYEVRSFDGWYKHITFACLALALLTVLSANSLDKKTIQTYSPGSVSLQTFKKGRNLHA
jgi:SRSO17 transposase